MGNEVTGFVCETLVSGKFRYRLHNFAFVESPGAYRGSLTAKLNSQSLNFRLSSVGEAGESPKRISTRPAGVAWRACACRASRVAAAKSPAARAWRADCRSRHACAATRISGARSAPQRGQIGTPRKAARHTGHPVTCPPGRTATHEAHRRPLSV